MDNRVQIREMSRNKRSDPYIRPVPASESCPPSDAGYALGSPRLHDVMAQFSGQSHRLSSPGRIPTPSLDLTLNRLSSTLSIHVSVSTQASGMCIETRLSRLSEHNQSGPARLPGRDESNGMSRRGSATGAIVQERRIDRQGSRQSASQRLSGGRERQAEKLAPNAVWLAFGRVDGSPQCMTQRAKPISHAKSGLHSRPKPLAVAYQSLGSGHVRDILRRLPRLDGQYCRHHPTDAVHDIIAWI